MNLNSSAEQPPTDHSKASKKKSCATFGTNFLNATELAGPTMDYLGVHISFALHLRAPSAAICEHNNRRFHLKHNFNIHFRSKGLFCRRFHVNQYVSLYMRNPKHVVANVVDDWLTEMVSNVLSLTDDGFQFSSGAKRERRLLTTNGLMKIVHFI